MSFPDHDDDSYVFAESSDESTEQQEEANDELEEEEQENKQQGSSALMDALDRKASLAQVQAIVPKIHSWCAALQQNSSNIILVTMTMSCFRCIMHVTCDVSKSLMGATEDKKIFDNSWM